MTDAARIIQSESQAIIDSALLAIGPIADKVSSAQMGDAFKRPPGSSPMPITGGPAVIFGTTMQEWADWVRRTIATTDRPQGVLANVAFQIGTGAQKLRKLGLPVAENQRTVSVPGIGSLATTSIKSIPALAPDTAASIQEKVLAALADNAQLSAPTVTTPDTPVSAQPKASIQPKTMAVINTDTSFTPSTFPPITTPTGTVAPGIGKILGGVGSFVGNLFSGGGGGGKPSFPVIPGGPPGITSAQDPCSVLPQSLQGICRTLSGQGGQTTVPVTGNQTVDAILQILGGTATNEVIPGLGGPGGVQTNQELADLLGSLGISGGGQGAAASGTVSVSACGKGILPVEAPVRTKTINKAPCGYSLVTRDWNNNGQPFPKAILTSVAKANGWVKRRPKPPITAAEFKTLKTAERVERKVKSLATKAGQVCRPRKR